MTLPDLLEEFNVVIDTADGLNELRSLILGLAVRGKLVPQDPDDEPASELLRKIEAERDRLYNEGEIRKPKVLEAVSLDEYPFKIPDNWEWVRLGDCILDIYGGSTPSKSNPSFWEGDIYWASVKDLDEEKVYLTKTIDKVTKKALKKNKTKFLPKGNVVVCTRMGLGKINLNKVDITINQDLKAIILPEQISQLFFYYTYRTMDIIGSGMTVSGIKQDDLINLPFQFPPLAEQHRIVQKIEFLFAEVDELEVKLNRQTQLDEKLQLAVNAEVQQAPDAEASKSAWNFITSNFDTLYHTPEAIENLKKNILNEAVRGRLVPQNPNDEPAFELLKKIEAEKQRLYEEGEIRKPKKLPPVKEDEIPFEIPDSWEWVKLGNVSLGFNNGMSKRSGDKGTKIPVIRLADIEDFKIDLNETRSIRLTEKELGRYIVTQNDLLITRVNGSVDLVGSFNLFNLNKKIAYCDHFVRMSLKSDLTNIEFLWLAGKTNLIRKQIESLFITTAGQKTINQKHLSNLLLPFPPLEEQRRIVRRIEELFAICDRFKAQLEQRRSVNEQLVKGLVQEVLEKAYSSEKESIQENEVSIAAEPEEDYLTKQQIAFIQILCIAHALYVLKQRNMLQGEMGLAKYVYLMDRIGGVNTRFKFRQNNFGPYPSNFRRRLFTRSKYFYKSGSKGYEVIDLTNKSDRLFEKETEQTDQIKNAMQNLTDVFKPYRKDRAHKLELMASVCWLVEKTRKTDFEAIWEELENWETPKRDDVNNKAELFTYDEVRRCLDFIREKEWDKKLISIT